MLRRAHPRGRTIVAIDGSGRAQRGGCDASDPRAGGVVWWAPGERHRVGAGLDGAMIYIALQETHGDAGVDVGDAMETPPIEAGDDPSGG